MKKIKKAIVSVYSKDGLDVVVKKLHELNIEIYSTGGTAEFIEKLNIPCHKIENLTQFPEILGGRVKTLHPSIFGGLLANTQDEVHNREMEIHELPLFDLLICNLYPFAEYLDKGSSEEDLIEKIDIGGVTLIRAAAKNYNEVLCASTQIDYELLLELLTTQQGATSREQRRLFAAQAFELVAQYDRLIADYFSGRYKKVLRYGENPHQEAHFEGNFDAFFDKLQGKEVSYNNILDMDAAVKTISDFQSEPTFVIIKHNNSCGLASRPTISEAYSASLACDPKSAFGGVLIANREIDIATAEKMNTLFFEIIIAPSYEPQALEKLKSKPNRIILVQKEQLNRTKKVRSALHGVLVQDEDYNTEDDSTWKVMTNKTPTQGEIKDLIFSIKAVKHLKSNAIAIVKNEQLIGMGCGQTSRIDAMKQAIQKAQEFNFDLKGAVMASDAFLPFSDCVELASSVGISSVAQPGGSIRDQDSVDYCNQNGMSMVATGIRHFNH